MDFKNIKIIENPTDTITAVYEQKEEFIEDFFNLLSYLKSIDTLKSEVKENEKIHVTMTNISSSLLRALVEEKINNKLVLCLLSMGFNTTFSAVYNVFIEEYEKG